MRTARLKVTMRDVVPAAVRVLDVPAACTLPELHDLLQAGLGWTDSHLHVFDGGDRHYGPASDDDWDDAQLDEAGVTLKALGSSFTYLYDLGDGWEHAVEVLGPGGDTPGCAAGEGACPPEDCGGPHGYAELLATDPAAGVAFRLDEREAAIAQAAGSMPETVRLVLELTCDGVKLTPGGRLPRVIVRAVQEHRPEWYSLRRPASVEEDLYPLLELHGLLRRAGLLTLRGGGAAAGEGVGGRDAGGASAAGRVHARGFRDRARRARRGRAGGPRSSAGRGAGAAAASAPRVGVVGGGPAGRGARCGAGVAPAVGDAAGPGPGPRPRRGPLPLGVDGGPVGSDPAPRRRIARAPVRRLTSDSSRHRGHDLAASDARLPGSPTARSSPSNLAARTQPCGVQSWWAWTDGGWG